MPTKLKPKKGNNNYQKSIHIPGAIAKYVHHKVPDYLTPDNMKMMRSKIEEFHSVVFQPHHGKHENGICGETVAYDIDRIGKWFTGA